MTKNILRYDKMVESALRGVVREALTRTAEHGLPGSHHFYITFRTSDPGVVIPDFLRTKYPGDMTIVLEHQFWDLAVAEDSFSVTLSFQNRPERLTIPLMAICAFADPSVKFGLQFQPETSDDPAASAVDGPGKKAPPAIVAGPKLVDSKAPAATSGKKQAAEKSSDDKRSGEKTPAERKAADVVTLDTFRKK